MKIAPSILTADFSYLAEAVHLLNETESDYIHVDVMDGTFVPNISFGFPVMEAITKHSKKPLDVHLMIQKPLEYVERFKEAGADIINIHFETENCHKTLQAIKNFKAGAGLAVNPDTAINEIREVLPLCDQVILMSVYPGFGGQKFLEGTVQKLAELDKLRNDKGLNFQIEIDGGVNLQNAIALKENGADMLVVGNYVFGAEDPVAAVSELKTALV